MFEVCVSCSGARFARRQAPVQEFLNVESRVAGGRFFLPLK
jgi:hypothetical protein